MNNEVGNLLQQLLHAGNGAAPAAAQDQFQQLARSSSPAQLSSGLTDAFNSEQTPSFGGMVAQMFGHASAEQKTGIVNRLLAGLGPAAQALLGQADPKGETVQSGTAPNALSTEQATQMSAGQIQDIATRAKDVDPGIVESMSNFYAEHPVLVKSLGAMALSIILGRMQRR